MPVELAFVVFFLAVIFGRYLNEQAMKALSVEEKARLIDGFGRLRVFGYIPLILIFASYWLALKYSVIPFLTASILYFGLLAVFVVAIQLYVGKKMRELLLPQEYIKKYGRSRLVQNAGFAVLIFSALIPSA